MSGKRFLLFILVFTFMLGILMPTSFNGKLYGKIMELLVWLLVSAFIGVLLYYFRINKKSMWISLWLIIYLFSIGIFRELGGGFDISLAIAAPFVCIVLVLSLSFDRIASLKVEKFLHLFIILSATVNFGIIAKVGFIIKLLHFFYTQYYPEALQYSVDLGKPVFLFGVHSYASFYYMLFFLLCYFTYKKNKKRLFWYYEWILLGYTVLLRSSSSLFFGCYMAVILVYQIFKEKKAVSLILLPIGLSYLILKYDLISKYFLNLTSRNNGILARYNFSSGLFDENWKIISSSLGIGFSIAREKMLYYGDSSYIYYFTLGNIILLTLFYTLLICFLFRNVRKFYAIHLSISILCVEFAVNASTTYRFIAVLLFCVLYLKILDGRGEQEINRYEKYSSCKNMCRRD